MIAELNNTSGKRHSCANTFENYVTPYQCHIITQHSQVMTQHNGNRLPSRQTAIWN